MKGKGLGAKRKVSRKAAKAQRGTANGREKEETDEPTVARGYGGRATDVRR
jgi:hypothetical protein